MENQNLGEKIVRNTVFNTIGRFWAILVSLFLTPYIIRHIGIERFGIWALVGVLTGYFGLLDLGLGQSFVKFISEYYAKREYKNINQIVNTGLVFYTILATVIIILAFLSISPLLKFLKVPFELYGEASFVFLLGVMLFAAFNILSPFIAIQSGLQRMDVVNKISIAVSVPMAIGTIFFLENGYGLPGLMINNAIILCISSLINLSVAFRILPQLRFNPSLFRLSAFKRLFNFGYKLQISAVANLVHFQMDKILLAYFLNIGLVTYYAVASQLASRIREIPVLLVSAIFPAASELEARTDKESLEKLYYRAMKYIILVGVPISLLIIALAKPFIILWLGEGYAISVLTLQILMAGYFFNILTGPGFFILSGMGKPQYGMWSSVVATVLNLVLSIMLVIKIGYFGVVIGTASAMLIAASYFIFMCHRIMKLSLWRTISKLLFKPFLAAAVPGLIIYLYVKQMARIGWLGLFGLGLLYLASFGIIIWLLKYLDDFDRKLLKALSISSLFK